MLVREPILVVGGGFGGLTTALALARRSYRTRVLEGSPEFGAIGYGIQFGPNVFHVFDHIEVTEQVLAIADSPAAVVMLDALDGRELVRIPTKASFRARFKYPYIIVHRIDLHNVLLNACRASDAIDLVSDAMVNDFEDRGDGVAVTTADGRTFSGQALVAADGFRSLFRAKLFGDSEPRPVGYAALRTIVPMTELKVDVPRDSACCGVDPATTSSTIRCATARSSTLWPCFVHQPMPREPMSRHVATSLNTYTVIPIR